MSLICCLLFRHSLELIDLYTAPFGWNALSDEERMALGVTSSPEVVVSGLCSFHLGHKLI